MMTYFRKLLTGALGLGAACLIAGGNQVLAQTWTELLPTGGPPDGRSSATAVYNSATNRMIVFGGANSGQFVAVPPSIALRNDVWVLTHADGRGGTPVWTQTDSGTGPSKRGWHTAVYDQAHNRMIVFGGNPNFGYCYGTVNDLWVLTNADGSEASTPQWLDLTPASGPTKRYLHIAFYDLGTNRMIMFGGADACVEFSSELWVLDNANGLDLGGAPAAPAWTQLVPTGTPPGANALRVGTYDPATNRLIVLGDGADADTLLNEVWVLENANGFDIVTALPAAPNWVQLSPTGTPPDLYHAPSLVYDPVGNSMTAFGGRSTSGSGGIQTVNNVWVLSNANGLGGAPDWTQLSPTGGPPIERFDHTAVHIPGTGRMTVFGGLGCIDPLGCDPFTNAGSQAGTYNDVWTLEIPRQGTDHFLCYDVKVAEGEPKLAPFEVDLSDQFGETAKIVKKTNLVCNPVDKNGEGVLNPEVHLTCYVVKDAEGEPEFERRLVSVDNQFGEDQMLEVKKPKILCVPSSKEVIE